MSDDENKLVFSVASPWETILYSPVNRSAPIFRANLTRSIQRKYYGLPEKLWVDSASDAIVVKTADKSLHLIKGTNKVWTRHEGLASVKEWVLGKVHSAAIPEEPSMNLVESIVDRLKEQASAVVSQVKAGVQTIARMLTEKTLPKSVAKASNNYLFVFFAR